MKFCSLASGSSGNCQYIEYKDTKIIIDAGLSGKKIEDNLEKIGVKANEIDAILVTHEHIDHIKSVGVLSRRHNIKVFSNMMTLEGMLPVVKKLDPKNTFIFENGKSFTFKDLEIMPISTFHDCASGCGFVVTGDKKISLLTDTGWVNADAMEKMDDSELFYLESNHDVDMLINGSYPYPTKQRILSTKGHLSNENAAEVLSMLLKKKKEKILLGHLSSDNNLPEVALKTVKDLLSVEHKEDNIDYTIDVAPRFLPSKVFEL
ncbi:MBL fold metallo-hydrolase [Peptoniphilus sp. AGMB00490]|uniref:MBL fold metallo-hydrolase n=1 Tax=Peptoniphilus faecalis TaxID=2731255 RepID=A0A848RI76_9FIRM|nr:MBL fold metallo-hydrolase [Peptoniphilus faecalis]NMW85695.1 MBL fold metallo-hydrolase [Peptoniphilus faecalis]